MSFEKLPLIEPIRRALEQEGYTTPTPIQEQAIPILLEGRDLLGCAQTGTGKTAAFSIPILQLLTERRQPHAQDARGRLQRPIKALILTPTRELAIQIAESITAYGRFTGLKHTVIYGGVSQHGQTDTLQRGVDILVATPGRLLDLYNQGYVSLQHLDFFVLDEADRMLDMGFIHDIRKVIALLPARRQTLFFSATMPPDIVKLADTLLTNPAKVEVTPISSTAEKVRQGVYFVSKDNKNNLLLHVLEDRHIHSALVFTRTKYGADKVARFLTKFGVRAEAIHGNKSQNARQNALNNFKNRKIRVLVATDIAARGIDVEDLSHVINFEIPNIPETYVHRIGRTGRAGASGIALSFCDQEEKAYLKDIQKLIGKVVPLMSDNPYPLEDSTPVDLPAAPVRKQTTPPAQVQRKPAPVREGGSRAEAPRPSASAETPQEEARRNKKRRWFGNKKYSGQ